MILNLIYESFLRKQKQKQKNTQDWAQGKRRIGKKRLEKCKRDAHKNKNKTSQREMTKKTEKLHMMVHWSLAGHHASDKK